MCCVVICISNHTCRGMSTNTDDLAPSPPSSPPTRARRTRRTRRAKGEENMAEQVLYAWCCGAVLWCCCVDESNVITA